MALVFTTGFLAVFATLDAAPPDREITARFPCDAHIGIIGRYRRTAETCVREHSLTTIPIAMLAVGKDRL
jgi:hypothetical protein